jgi:uncharacterized protein (DUF58 family)
VLGPLPTIYRIVVFACALVACVGVGAWLASMLPGAMLGTRGAGIGAVFGALLAVLLLYPFDRPRSGAPVRVRARHRR